jgi:hypothetical protein
MDNIIVTIELALLIILPLILYYQRINKGYKIYMYVLILYLIWFATYSLFHELCHVLGSWMTGAKIYDYQLVPRFLEGDFKNGYVKSNLENGFQLFFSPISPYLRDMIFLFIGYVILKKVKIAYLFVTGLVVILFILSPLYDVFNNYFAFVLGAQNDFNCIKGSIGSFWTHLIGLFFTLAGLIAVWGIFIISREQLKNN